MADELTSQVSAPETPSAQPEQAQPASQPEPRQETPESVQPAQPAQTGLPDNWQDDPKFKVFQRDYNKSLNEERKRRAALEQQLSQLSQQFEQVATRDMTEEERFEHERTKYQQELERERSEKMQLQQEYAKELSLAAIAAETGVPVSLIADAESPDDAWKVAIKEAAKSQQSRIKQLETELADLRKERLAEQPGNTADMGGSTRTATPRVDDAKWDTNEGLVDFYRRQWDAAYNT